MPLPCCMCVLESTRSGCVVRSSARRASRNPLNGVISLRNPATVRLPPLYDKSGGSSWRLGHAGPPCRHAAPRSGIRAIAHDPASVPAGWRQPNDRVCHANVYSVMSFDVHSEARGVPPDTQTAAGPSGAAATARRRGHRQQALLDRGQTAGVPPRTGSRRREPSARRLLTAGRIAITRRNARLSAAFCLPDRFIE